MWDTSSLWFEVSIVSTIVALGHILLGQFEERTPRIRKLIKYIITLALSIGLSFFFGRVAMFIFLTVFLVLALYIHIIYLPKKGINGWTSEPKKKYYELRGWETDVFTQKSKN